MQTSSRRSLLRGLSLPLALLAGGLLAPGAHAQSNAPLAGTPIGNKASATYSDFTGVQRSTQSNTVTTTVSAVPALSLIDNRNIRGFPGAPVYFTHTVTNTGNTPDSFNLAATLSAGTTLTGLTIYADANGDGVPDSSTPITVSPNLQPGQTFSFVVAGTVTTGAAAGATDSVNVTATSVLAAGTNASNTDSLTVSTNANVVLRKSVSVGQGAPGDGKTYTYTLTYINNSQTDAGKTTITDAIPAGLVYAAGSAKWNQGNTSLTDASDGNEATVGGASIDYSFTAGAVKAVISKIPAQSQGTITFSFTVPSTTAPGTINNIANLSYDDDSNSGTPDITDKSNQVPFVVASSAGVQVTGQTLPNIPQGGTAVFTNPVKNNGTGTDTFNISLAPGATAFPAGTTFQLFKSDGVTPLLDTNGDGIPDTGPVGPGATVNIVVKAILPAQGTGGPFTQNVTATSVATSGVLSTGADTVSVTATTMDLTNTTAVTAQQGTGPFTNTLLVSKSGNPGTTVAYPLTVTNNGATGTTDTFVLSVLSSAPGSPAQGLPAGYSVVFTDATTGQVISSVNNLPGGQSRNVIATITVPKTANGNDTTALYFSANSPTSGVGDTVYDNLVVGVVRGIAVKDPQNGQVYPGSSVTYLNTVTNTGDITESNIQIARTGDANGFTSVAYLDTNNNGVLDPSEQTTPITSIASLAPGASQGVFIKVFGPQDTSQVGRINGTTLTAQLDGDLVTAGFQAGGPTGSVTDNTTLVVGDVRLQKLQSLDGTNYVQSNLSAKPGDTIYYRIVVTNSGTANVTNVVVSDFTPAYTLASNVIAATYTDQTGAAQPAQTAPANGAAGAYSFQIGTLAPGQSSTINFAVKVQK